MRQKKLNNIMYSGIHPSDNSVNIQQSKYIEEIGDIASLNENILQSEKYMQLVYEEK